jgi:hypothetical protein
LRPPRTDIAAPPFPPDTDWVGAPPQFERALAAGPTLVHFFDFAQLNSGWPALFLWGRGGALRWYHLGEGEYLETEKAIQEALRDATPNGHELPSPLEPLRPSDVPGARVVAPTPEHFPGGGPERPGPKGERIELDYEAGGAYAAVDGQGEIAAHLDRAPLDSIVVSQPGLYEIAVHERTERHSLELEPSSEVSIYSVQFAAAPPA